MYGNWNTILAKIIILIASDIALNYLDLDILFDYGKFVFLKNLPSTMVTFKNMSLALQFSAMNLTKKDVVVLSLNI